MECAITRPRTALLLGVAMAIPFTLMLGIARLSIEPLNSIIDNLFRAGGERTHILGFLFIIGAFLLLPVALALNAAVVGRGLRAGGRMLAHPANFLLALGLLTFIVALITAFVVDQYPCWTGVPNCD